MKTIIMILTIVSLIFAQETVTISIDSLPADMKAKYQTQAALEKVQKTSENMASIAVNAEAIGKSVGSAMREGLGALTEETNKFAKTDVGKFTAVIIAWKVLGKEAGDLLGSVVFVAVSLPIFIILLCIWIWSFRKLCLDHKIVEYDIIDGKKTLKSIKYLSPVQLRLVSDEDASTMIHWSVLLIAIAIYMASLGSVLF